MATAAKEVLTDISPVITLYTDGTIDRLIPSPNVPPSPEDPSTGVASKDITISPAVSGRLHRPKLTDPAQKLPILLYYHGGGFCIGSAFSLFDFRYLNLISAQSGALILSVDYRLAPEHPLPAAYEDSWEALKWICDKTNDEWIADHADLTRVFVGGDSAGGNIAHNIAIRAGSEPLPGGVRIAGAILSHPFFWGSDPVGNEPTEGREENLLQKFWVLGYPTAAGGVDNPLINPFGDGAPDLSGLGCSRIMVCLAEKDVLTARGRVYAEEVEKSGWGGEVEVVEVEGEDHCFQYFDTESDKARDLIRRMADFISR